MWEIVNEEREEDADKERGGGVKLKENQKKTHKHRAMLEQEGYWIL